LLKYDGKSFTQLQLKKNFPAQKLDFLVTDILEDHALNIWVATTYGLALIQDGQIKIFTTQQGLLNNILYDLEEDETHRIWMGTEKGLSAYDGKVFTYYTEKEGFTSHAVKTVKAVGKNIWAGTFGSGLIKYDGTYFEHYNSQHGLNSNHVFSIIPDKEEIWIGTRFGINKLTKNQGFMSYGYEEGFLGLGCNGNAALKDQKGNVWFCTSDRLTQMNTSLKDSLAPSPNILDLSVFGKSIEWSNPPEGVYLSNHEGLNLPDNLSLPYTLNYLSFTFNGITTRFPQKVQFQYKLEGFDSDWREISLDDKAHYPNLPSGNYQFLLKTANSSGKWSEPVSYQFRIRPPWWKTWWFLLLALFSAIIASISYVRWREKSLREEQKRLQKIVDEQTFEIRAALEDLQIANEEINAQAEELRQQNDILHEQQLDIQSKNKQIMDSLNYGKRIQEAMLPEEKWMKTVFPKSFVFLKPKDIVSGDFYWLGCVGTKKIFATVDCTGHGVPGAFMSMIGHELLNEIVLAKNITRPDLILNELHAGVQRILKQHSSENYDGMDLSLVSVDETQKEILFAGAQNPLYLIENNEFKVIPADKKSIGGKQAGKEIQFTLQTIHYQSPVQLFLASDGYQDQFGGSKGRKYMTKNFRELLASLKSQTPENQKENLQQTLNKWMGRYAQMDDIIVVGIHL
jgi:serine phosphatase RsbU (regulator of sigma subunit)